jgi:NB-ARC domain/Rx N-terminal domain
MATIIENFVGNYLLNKLAAFIEEKVVMIYGVKDELKRLETKMKNIRAFLRDADRRRITDEVVNNWLNQLKDVMYDADDLIDLWRYNYQSLPPEEPSALFQLTTCCPLPLFSCFLSNPMHLEIAEQVKSLNVRLEDISNDMSRLNLQQLPSEFRQISTVDASVSSSIIGVDIVGNEIEESAKKLVKMATTDNKQNFNNIAITGMGGIGKTTLAQRIYNDQTIKNNFGIKIWLRVSQYYSPTQLIKEAITNAGGNFEQAESIPMLLSILESVISKKSFFLVLDDVWKPDILVNLLLDVLTKATNGVILVTTRDQTVAMQMGVRAENIHQATILSINSGWEMLCKKTYLINTIDIEYLQGVGIEIVKRCGGLPLAIKAIAGVLAGKSKSINEWENVLKNKMWSVDDLPKEINGALYLSYEDLSADLKQCFLYCSFYPSNKAMHRNDIVEDWIAQGFIKEREYQIIEESAADCYDELIKRHLLEPVPFYTDHSECKMHDVLKSLGQCLSMGESFSGDQMFPSASTISRLRHLFIGEANETISLPGAKNEPLRLRTFIILKCLSEIDNQIFIRIKNLRVLCINEKGLKSIPDSIGDLIHLRELDLDYSSISNLPESIGSLTNLLFLKLAFCKLLNVLPTSLTRLCNLRHLKVEGTPLTFFPKGLGRLEKLTEIWGFQVVDDGDHDGWDLKELEGLFQLRRILIHKLERAKNVSVVIANKTHLKELVLTFSKKCFCCNCRSGDVEELENKNNQEILEKLYPPPCIEKFEIMNYRGKTLPKWMSSSSLGDIFSNLQYLCLTGWSCCTDLPPLGLLPSLKYLKIRGASSIVRISPDFLGIRWWKGPNLPILFPKLEYLFFENMPNWKEWTLPCSEGENSPSFHLMPHIKTFVIEKCPKLRVLPEGLKQLKEIKRLSFKEADSIRSIHDLPFECGTFCLTENRYLESLSNLPGVKEIHFHSNPNLRHVSKLDSLELIILEDHEMECLPEWLMKFMEERKGHKADKIHLDLFCNKVLLERCQKNGPDWPIIECFSSVSVHNEDRSASLKYTREPESYYANLSKTISKVHRPLL